MSPTQQNNREDNPMPKPLKITLFLTLVVVGVLWVATQWQLTEARRENTEARRENTEARRENTEARRAAHALEAETQQREANTETP